MGDFEEIYDHSVKLSHNLIEDIRFSRNIEYNHIQILSYEICDYLENNNNIMDLLQSVQDKNPYIDSHPVNVAFISYFIGKWIDLKKDDLVKLIITGFLHDIGKAKIRDSILNKTQMLTELELQTVRNHPTVGFRILASLNECDPDILLGVLSHHERQNGDGYPRKLKGDQINKYGRLVAISDIYAAMTSTRPYRNKNTPFKAIEEIQDLSFGYLDPQMCQTFLNHIFNFYYGKIVKLNDERVGEIVYINVEERTKPIIHCENEYIDLKLKRDIEIVDIL